MKVIKFICVIAISIAAVLQIVAAPAKVTSVHIPLQGELDLSNGDVVSFTGQVHVLTRVTFSDTFVPAVQMYFNLQGVQGTSAISGRSYVLVGAANANWVGINPGPPDIPEQTFGVALVEVNPGPPGTSPGPPNVPPSPIVPIYLREFTFAQEAGFEGSLQHVVASFVAE